MLGQGAMGSVWKAAHAKTGELVAIKVLVEHLARVPDFIWRFEREAAALAAVRHQGVVALKDRGNHEGVHYLIMEYVDGEPIRREMERTRMPANRAVAICRRVARGLEAAHRAGIVHRDLKPENVLLSKQGELKIVDFGLAGLAEEVNPHPNLTRSRVTMGTVNYMAPEQRTDAKRVDKRADIYSLGVILYEMFTRDLPLGRFQFPHERGFPVPAFADDLLRRALATQPSDRQQTAIQLDGDLAELERILANPALEDTTSKRRWWPFN
jgi:serine/threonine-protein kinase